ncbi:MAG: cytochrome c biogenesis protein CcsA [Pyrobaculum sp.]
MDLPYAVLIATAAFLNAAAFFYRRAAPAAASASLALLAYHWWLYFAGRFDVAVVYINAASGQTALERAAAALASIPGAVFVITAALAAASALLKSRAGHLVASLLTAYAAAERPFETLGANPQTGLGLNPLLRSPWAVPHPLAVLVGYGLLLASAAADSQKAARWAWLLLSAGLLMGAVWSYQTFGWAGYWAWDPVENALLAVWLAATASLHLNTRGSRIAAAGVALGAVAVNQGGFSALHSFVGSTPTPQILLAASIAAVAYGAATSYAKMDWGRAASGLGLLALALVVYAATAAPAAYSALTGARLQPPAGDSFVQTYVPVLAAAVYTGLFVSSAYHAGLRRWKEVAAVYAAILAASAAAAQLFKYASESPISTNFFVYLIIGGAAAAVYYVARGRGGFLYKALHAAAFALLALIALSGPYAYGQGYYKLLPVDEVGATYFTLLQWPYPQTASIEEYQVVPDPRVVAMPEQLQASLPNYTAFVKKFGGVFSLEGVNYTVVKAAGVDWVVVWNGGVKLGEVGGVPVAEVEKNGTAVVFPAPLDLVKALEADPQLVKRFFTCRNSSAAVPGGLEIRGVVKIDGAEAPFLIRYDFSGAVKGVGAVTLGVVDVYKPLAGLHVVVAPPAMFTEAYMWDYATAQYARLLLDMCNADAAYAVLARQGVSNLTAAVRYLREASPYWVLGLKPVPAITELWACSASLLILSAAYFILKK